MGGGASPQPLSTVTTIWANWITNVGGASKDSINYLTNGVGSGYIDLLNGEATKLYVYESNSGDIPTYSQQNFNAQSVDYAGGNKTITNNYEITGLKNIAARGRNGNALLTKINTMLTANIAGKMNANPQLAGAYLKQVAILVADFNENTLPEIANRMNASNNFGSYAHQAIVAKACDEIMERLLAIGVDVFFKDYLLERNIQDEALTPIIDFGDEEIHNAELQRRAGMMMREWYQGQLLNTYKIWQADREALILQLEIQGNAISKSLGGTVTTATPYYQASDAQVILGASMAGLGAYLTAKDAGLWERPKEIANTWKTRELTAPERLDMQRVLQ